MIIEQTTIFAILACALALFVWDRVRYDVVALLALLAVVVTGLVPAEQAFAGFSDPAVVTVAAVLVLSSAIRNSGLVELIIRPLGSVMQRTGAQVFVLATLVTGFSAFMNNVGAMAVFLPVALQVAHRSGRSPAPLLMPLAFGSLLGGLTTLIGTPPNILISDVRQDLLGEGFGMFDFTPVGLGVALAGVAFLSVGWRLVPGNRKGEVAPEALFRIEDYMSEVRVPPGSPMADKTVADLEALGEGDLTVTAVVRDNYRRYVPLGHWRVLENDILVLESDPHVLKKVVDGAKLELVGSDEIDVQALGKEEGIGVVEAVVTAGSQLVGRSPAALRLRDRYAVNLLAVSRSGSRTTARLRQLAFQAGDVVVLQGELRAMPEILASLGCLPLAERNLQLGRPRKLLTPVLIMAAAVALTVAGILPVAIAFLGAVCLIILLGALTLKEVYDSVDWPVLILLGAMIPVSDALSSTGGTEVIAGWLSMGTAALPPVGSLALIMVATMLVTPVLNNAATVLVMAPIAASFASQLGLKVDPFLMAVAVGASCDFLTPIGHQSNTLVMGPGGYKFGDYWRLGLPLSLLVVAIGIPLIVLVWPLA